MLPNALAQISVIAMLIYSQVSPIMPDRTLASHQFSLNSRYAAVESVNSVMKDNILLSLAYMNGNVKSTQDINWSEIEKPAHYQFKLEPNQTFAFHDDVLSEYSGKVSKTTNARFNFQEGFKSDGYLFGDGVCHLASLIYWVAKDAGLSALAPTNHDFMDIPEISKEYGVSIFSNPYSKGSNSQQNLYVTNNKNKAIIFKFDYSENKLKVSVVEVN